MSHCRSSLVRLCARRAALLGVEVEPLLRSLGWSLERLESREPRVPWSVLVVLLEELERAIGGPRAIEQFGAELGANHPLFQVLKTLHFELPEVQALACDRVLSTWFDGVFRSVVSLQPDGAVRATLSLGREHANSYPFWSLLLGLWRPLPRHFGMTDSVVEAEMADRFAEFLIILPPGEASVSDAGQAICQAARERILGELLVHEELHELPLPNPGSSLLERRLEACEGRDGTVSESNPTRELVEFGNAVRSALEIDRLQLFDMTAAGWRRVLTIGIPLDRARLRRAFWLSGNAVGAIEVERAGGEGYARVASLLDEHIDRFAKRFAEIRYQLPAGSIGGFEPKESSVRENSVTVEAPPSSRGRVARAARDSRLRELATEWQLTERQREVLALLVEGFANKEIAVRLDCSVGTVENHATRLFRRAGVDCRAALTAAFWRTSRAT